MDKRTASYLLPDPGGEVVRECLEENDKLRAALTLLLGWHDEVRKQTIIPSPFGIEKAREALGVI